MLNTHAYPTKGEKIDYWDKKSKYIIKIIAPSDISVAFKEYSYNFFRAAHLIGEHLLEADNPMISELDTYFFSLAFLYRHSIELMLKAIAFQHIENDTDRVSFIKDTFHNLEEILIAIEADFPSPRPNDEMVWLRNYFSSISTMDKESDSFRYPFHIIRGYDWLDGAKYIVKRVFEKQTHIDLLKFANKFEVAYEILEKWYVKSSDDATEWSEWKPIFIEEGGSYYEQSVVGYAYNRDDFHSYTNAYLGVANYLRQYMKEQFDLGEIQQAEKLFMPMCYLFRNCTELSLKEIWFSETGENFDLRCKMMLDKKHSIIGMWNLIKSYTKECEQHENDKEYIGILESYCNQLHSIDSDASKFRYPVNKIMQPYFANNKRFDFLHTGIFLEALNNALGGLNSSMNAINEWKAEMEAEYRSEMMSDYDPYF